MYHTLSPLSTPSIGYPPRRCQVPPAAHFSAANPAVRCPISAAVKSPSAAHFSAARSAAIVLLVCVPLIPVVIAAVQTWAKKLLGKYWGQYTALDDTFLENLQGLTTLKIYPADKRKNQEMDREAEEFRRITMKVLTTTIPMAKKALRRHYRKTLLFSF